MSAYRKAIEEYTEALDAAHKIAHDPFKAPELNVEESHNLLSAIWKLQVAYAAMIRKPEED